MGIDEVGIDKVGIDEVGINLQLHCTLYTLFQGCGCNCNVCRANILEISLPMLHYSQETGTVLIIVKAECQGYTCQQV